MGVAAPLEKAEEPSPSSRGSCPAGNPAQPHSLTYYFGFSPPVLARCSRWLNVSRGWCTALHLPCDKHHPCLPARPHSRLQSPSCLELGSRQSSGLVCFGEIRRGHLAACRQVAGLLLIY